MTKQYAKLGKYVPKLTLYKRFDGTTSSYELGVEFSAPKLLRGNNFEELTGADLPFLVEALQRVLYELTGYTFPLEEIANSNVSVFHPSKNIVLPHVTACRAVIAAIAKLDITMTYDVHRTDYRDGYLLHLHANTIDIAFYDKLADLRTSRKSVKRSHEQEPILPSSIVDKLIVGNERDVLRYEIRLNNRKKIKQTYPELDEWTLANMFHEEICQQLLVKHWKNITKSIDLIDMDADKPYEILHNLLVSNNGQNLRQNLATVAGLTIINQIGVRDFRHLVGGSFDTSTWYRLKASLVMPSKIRSNWVLAVDEALTEFNPIKASDLTGEDFDRMVDFGNVVLQDFDKEDEL